MAESPPMKAPLLLHPLSLMVHILTDGTSNVMGDVMRLQELGSRERAAYALSQVVNTLLANSPHHFSQPSQPSEGWPTVPLQARDCLRGNSMAQRWMQSSE